MGKEVRITDHDVNGRATDWITGLPNLDDLPPLSQLLISPELASAFNISPEPHRNMTDVTRASHNTLSTLINVDLTPEGSVSRKLRRVDSGGGGDGGGGVEDGDSASGGDDCSARISKRIRLVWTPQLHKRFVEVVRHLGVKNAVPKTIMQLMNVEGLTRENVASHLQKYRLYLKRMPESDHPFGSTPVPKRLHHSVGYQNPPPHLAGGYHSHPYNNNNNMMMMQQKDWSGNGFGSVSPYQHCITPNDK